MITIVHVHYNDVITSTMASQITSLTIVYSRRRSKKASKSRVTGLCEGNSPVTGEFPAQRASNAENVSIWLRHHGSGCRGGCVGVWGVFVWCVCVCPFLLLSPPGWMDIVVPVSRSGEGGQAARLCETHISETADRFTPFKDLWNFLDL